MPAKDHGQDQKTHTLYHEQGMGLRIPPGERPAVLIIDMQHDFCRLRRTDHPMAVHWSDLRADQAAVRGSPRARRPCYLYAGPGGGGRLLGGAVAIQTEIPCRGTHPDRRQPWRANHPGACASGGRPADPQVAAERFFHTDLEVFLGAQCIDTLLCCGTSVSGCVRATVTDAFMRDIRCMVIRDCVADRTTAVLEANLFDLDQKYADVVSLAETLDYLATLPVERTAAATQS